MNRLTRLALAAAGLCSVSAGAAPILQASNPFGTGSTYLALNNDLGLGSTSQSVLVGYRLDATGAGSLLYTYLGKEGGYTNSVGFSLNAGGCTFVTGSTAIGATCSDTTTGGALVFSFSSSGSAGTLANGANFSLSSPINFGLQRLTARDWRVLLDDSGGSPNDKDFDDLGIRVSFIPTSVPEPASLGLLGLGLMGLGLSRRKKQRA